ncbi:hypothetical protein ACWDTI_06545 [Gordonia sp. NPDC003424]
MGTRPGMRPRPAVCCAVVVCAVVACAATGCASTVDGTAQAPSAEVSSYRSDMSASRASTERTRGAVELCQTVMSSAGSMVRGYNDLVVRLNATDSYDAVGDLDDKARAGLIAGADQIRAKLTESTPADVGDPANAFLASTGALGDAIAKRQLSGLNSIADRWTQDKQILLTRCATYLPLPPATAATPAPSAPVPSPPG